MRVPVVCAAAASLMLRAAGDGNEVGVQDGSHVIDILGGDPVAASNAYPKSVELANAIIAAPH